MSLPGLGRQRCVQRNEVGLREQIVELQKPSAGSRCSSAGLRVRLW